MTEEQKDRKKSYNKAYYESHKDELAAKKKAYYESHKDEHNARCKAYIESHKEKCRTYQKECLKAWRKSHKEQYRSYDKAYKKDDVNASGQTKNSIRVQSQRYLSKYGTKIPGYQIHHCCTYDEPYKFIYCPKEMHQLIHNYLREHNIDADTDHFEQIKHLLDDTVVLYGITNS